MSANLRAYLFTLRWAEGTDDDNGYRALFGHRKDAPLLFDSFADHPRIRTYETHDGQFIKNGRLDFTTAAGAYQITASTWDDFIRAVGPREFSPEHQDECAIWLIRTRARALDDIEAGRLRDALRKCAPIWASLPDSIHPQPRRSYEACERVFVRAGGFLATRDSGPVLESPPPPQPASPMSPAPDYPSPGEEPHTPAQEPHPTAPSKEEPMHPVIAAIGSEAVVGFGKKLLQLLPWLSSGSPTAERNIAMTQELGAALLDVAAQVLPGAANEQQRVEAIMADRALQARFRSQAALSASELAPLVDLAIRLGEAETRSADAAVQRTLELGTAGWAKAWPFILVAVGQWLLTAGTIGGLFTLIWPVVQKIAAGGEVADVPSWIAGIIGSVFAAVILEWRSITFNVTGRNQSSDAKDALIGRLASGREPSRLP